MEEYIAQRRVRGGVGLGMSESQALSSSWGEPDQRNYTGTARGREAQWVYGGYHYLYFVNGLLTGVQTDELRYFVTK
jgi:hypothetical protein